MGFDAYQAEGFHDEMFTADGTARPEARLLVEHMESLEEGQLLRRRALLQLGITFNLYGD